MGPRSSLLPDLPHSSDSSEEDIDIEETSKGTLDSDEETSDAAMEVRPAASASKQSSVSKKKIQASASHSQPAKAVASKPAKKKLAATPEKPSPAKRPREAEDSKHTKKNKKKKKKNSEAVDGGRKNSEEEVLKTARGGESKKLFERLWSEENEIAILKGIIEYAVKNNIQPEEVEMGKPLDFIKEPLGFEFTKRQLQEKARRLKSIYEKKVAKKNYPTTGGHDLELFNLSAEIWGQCPDGASRLGSKSPTKGEALISLENGWDGRFSDHSKVRTQRYMERAMKVLDSFSDSEPNKAEFDEELKKIEEADLDVLLKESELTSKQLKFATEVLRCRR